MIDIEKFEASVKKGQVDSSYIFCGQDEDMIKDSINLLVKKVVDEELKDLNYIRLDGLTTSFEEIQNACETISFFGGRKVIEVYRANFIREKTDSTGKSIYTELVKYLKDMPEHSVLIFYYVFEDKRERPNKNRKLTTLEKTSTVVFCEKLKKDKYYKKIEEVFKDNGIVIGKIEAKYFGDRVQNNFQIIKNEVEKLAAYCTGRSITRKDIDTMLATRSEDDIFDLIEYVSQKKAEKALDLMDELLFREDQHMLIIVNIQNQIKKLIDCRILLNNGKKMDDIIKQLRLPPFVCEKLSQQSRKFSVKQLNKMLEITLESERKIKSSGIDKKTELELMLFKIFMVK